MDSQDIAFSGASTVYSAQAHETPVQLENNADKSEGICNAKELVLRI